MSEGRESSYATPQTTMAVVWLASAAMFAVAVEHPHHARELIVLPALTAQIYVKLTGGFNRAGD